MNVRCQWLPSAEQIPKLFALMASFLCLVVIDGLGCSRTQRQTDKPTKQSGTHGISIEASRPVSIIRPFDVVPIGEKGECGLWLEPEWTENESHSMAEATYRFYVPASGQYSLWAYCFWRAEGPNALNISIDGKVPDILAGDEVYHTWHWVNGDRHRLTEGMHTLTITPCSSNLGVRKIFLINSNVDPEAHGVVVSELFRDDFDGCYNGNIGLWEQHLGEWQIVDAEIEQNRGRHVLVGRSYHKAMLWLPGEEWNNYVLDVRCRRISATSPDSMLGICFGMTEIGSYYILRWREIPTKGQAAMQIVKSEPKYAKVIASFDVPWATNQWHDVRIELQPGQIGVAVDYGKKIKVSWKHRIIGGIGLWLAGQTEAEFDDVEVRPSCGRPNPSQSMMVQQSLDKPVER